MKESRQRIRDGFSLVEMIIVIAIIGILVTSVSVSVVLLRSADTKEVAYDINNGLTNLKSKTLGDKDQPYMYLYCLDDTYYMNISYTEPDLYVPTTDATPIENTQIKIFYGEEKKPLIGIPDGFLCVGFRKKDGAFLVEGKCICPEEIYVEAENATSYVVHMVQDTGNHYIEEK